MGIKELAAKIAAAHPEIAATQINKVLRTTLSALSAELGEAADGTMKLAPLGNFHVSSKPAKGEEGAEGRRRIVLKLARTKSPEAAAKRSAKKAANPDRGEARAAKKVARQAGKEAKQAAKAAKASKASKSA